MSLNGCVPDRLDRDDLPVAPRTMVNSRRKFGMVASAESSLLAAHHLPHPFIPSSRTVDPLTYNHWSLGDNTGSTVQRMHQRSYSN